MLFVVNSYPISEFTTSCWKHTLIEMECQNLVAKNKSKFKKLLRRELHTPLTDPKLTAKYASSLCDVSAANTLHRTP